MSSLHLPFYSSKIRIRIPNSNSEFEFRNTNSECRRYICLFILRKYNSKIVQALDLWVILQFTLWIPELLNNNRAHVLEASPPRQRPREANRSLLLERPLRPLVWKKYSKPKELWSSFLVNFPFSYYLNCLLTLYFRFLNLKKYTFK